MQIKFVSITVEDQESALRFYTSVLGFEKMEDIPMGEYRWLTVTSPEGIEGVEPVLEPLGFPPARAYQQALLEAGIPATAFITKDIAPRNRFHLNNRRVRDPYVRGVKERRCETPPYLDFLRTVRD